MRFINALVLQGGGALGGYQVGVYEALESHNYVPDLVVGISIGAINAAIIAGNPPQQRLSQLLKFWSKITHNTHYTHNDNVYLSKVHNKFSAAFSLMYGQTGFFKPKLHDPRLLKNVSPENLSYYDSDELYNTLLQFIDFDYLNSEHSIRLSVGATALESGHFMFFDNKEMEILPEHIMASCALPPGLPPVKINGEYYIDGGIFLNTPMARVFDIYSKAPYQHNISIRCFMVDLFSISGKIPQSMDGLMERVRDIRFSSRFKRLMDAYSTLQETRETLHKMTPLLTPEQKKHPLFKSLLKQAHYLHMDIIHLTYKSKPGSELSSKTYEFSQASYTVHKNQGYDVTIEIISKYTHIWSTIRKGGIEVFNEPLV